MGSNEQEEFDSDGMPHDWHDLEGSMLYNMIITDGCRGKAPKLFGGMGPVQMSIQIGREVKTSLIINCSCYESEGDVYFRKIKWWINNIPFPNWN